MVYTGCTWMTLTIKSLATVFPYLARLVCKDVEELQHYTSVLPLQNPLCDSIRRPSQSLSRSMHQGQEREILGSYIDSRPPKVPQLPCYLRALLPKFRCIHRYLDHLLRRLLTTQLFASPAAHRMAFDCASSSPELQMCLSEEVSCRSMFHVFCHLLQVNKTRIATCDAYLSRPGQLGWRMSTWSFGSAGYMKAEKEYGFSHESPEAFGS